MLISMSGCASPNTFLKVTITWKVLIQEEEKGEDDEEKGEDDEEKGEDDEENGEDDEEKGEDDEEKGEANDEGKDEKGGRI
jgi:hypothetical protein